VVAAPSKLQRPPGDRVKTDARDARHLANLLRMDQIVEVRVPSVEQEAARDLVRAREDVRGDLMRDRQRLSKLLLRQGILYSGGHPWTGVHEVWLRGQRFALPGLQSAFDSALETVLLTTARRNRLDAAISEMAFNSEYTPVVRRLCCLRGVSVGRRTVDRLPRHWTRQIQATSPTMRRRPDPVNWRPPWRCPGTKA
jgi:hypothetical protein